MVHGALALSAPPVGATPLPAFETGASSTALGVVPLLAQSPDQPAQPDQPTSEVQPAPPSLPQGTDQPANLPVPTPLSPTSQPDPAQPAATAQAPGQPVLSQPVQPQPVRSQPVQSQPVQPGAAGPTPGTLTPLPQETQRPADIASFVATIVDGMQNGPRVWQSPDALIPDFDAITRAVGSLEGKQLDLRVVIWGPHAQALNAEEVAYKVGQALPGTVIAISPTQIGVYSTKVSADVIDQVFQDHRHQLTAEQDPAVIVQVLLDAFGPQHKPYTYQLPLFVGLAIIVVGLIGWFGLTYIRRSSLGSRLLSLMNQPVTFGAPVPRDTPTQRPETEAVRPATSKGRDLSNVIDLDDDAVMVDDHEPDLMTGTGSAISLTQRTSPRRPGTAGTSRSTDSLDPDAASTRPADQGPRSGRNQGLRAVGRVGEDPSGALAFAKMAHRQRLEHIGMRFVQASEGVVISEDMSLMNDFNAIGRDYRQVQRALDEATTAKDFSAIDQAIGRLSTALGALEQRFERE